MNRFRGYSNLAGRTAGVDGEALNRKLRALGASLQRDGWAHLRLSAARATALKKHMRHIAEIQDSDEALRRLKADSGLMEACLRQAQEHASIQVPATRGCARVLSLARMLVCDGEWKLTRDRLMEGVAAFDEGRAMTMGEFQFVPAALQIALCEALERVARDVLCFVRARGMAEEWMRTQGKRNPTSCCDEAFLERALELCAEMEQPEMHARLRRLIERCGQREGWILERAQRIAAENYLRLENLMDLRLLLDRVHWQKCFEQLCGCELELREDPSGVYPAMDAPSRAQVRQGLEELARKLKLEEGHVVRHALILARACVEAHGAQDPRSTVCWYLEADEGREALCKIFGEKPPKKRICDASGRISVILLGGLSLALLVLCAWAISSPLLLVNAIPIAWVLANRLTGRFYSLWIKPVRILKLKLHSIPEDARTLVALPVLLSSEARAREMCAHMEALGCLEKDEAIDFLLLGDFKDGANAHAPEDEGILRAAREAVAGLNARAGRQKYFYLHRERKLRQRDGRWMGENRKRGAMMQLNHLLLQRGDVQDFAAEGSCAQALAERKYRYVVTLDADTQYLPGTLQRLVGAMLHPMNRVREDERGKHGYAVLQPAMQLTAEGNENAYVALTAGEGGVDSYPVTLSDFYQDMTGRGCFAGKGIYDLHAFSQATEGVLHDDAILSHDLIEGILSGAGFLNDVQFYDGCPTNLGADLVRLNRWTRGDWQLLPVLFSKIKMAAVDRMKIAGNLLRSFYAPALTALLVGSLWFDRPGAFILGLVAAFIDPLLALGRGGWRSWRAALLQLAVLPAVAACNLDAIVRTLWRLAVSRKHLMDWVPAADAMGGGKMTRLPGRITALLVLPALLRPFWIPAALALAALFWVGADWARDLARMPSDARTNLNAHQMALLNEIAQRTWHFFEVFVPEDGNGLPPDNVQLDPPVGAARRTSPTNVGLYLMSCLSARELGFLNSSAMLRRMTASVDTLEKMEKWKGQFYNWYDTDTLLPLRPRYVSAVDSGNLAGALLLCARALKKMDEALSERMESLARGMDLSALYDAQRELFCIGMDVENGQLSQSHYDLYASEARILSYTAMMLGQAPLRHWKHLSRAAVRVGKEQALLSWSGTMFEYLMPEIWMHSHAASLAGQSRQGAVACQRRQGRLLDRPWGISESGYCAFDLQLNYQYQAFGLRSLALNGSAIEDVVAPYAAALALSCDPAAAADNLARMCQMGWWDEYGLYEAADYLHLDAEGHPQLVRSHMAHHQGMALCALCNALRDDILPRTFMQIPEARALKLLLQEKSGARLRIRRGAQPPRTRRAPVRAERSYQRMAHGDNWATDAHLIHGGETTALITARGACHAYSRGLQLNRFSSDLRDPHEGMYVHVQIAGGEDQVMGQSGKVSFDAGSACFEMECAGQKLCLRTAVSPEDGTLYQQLEVENTTQTDCEMKVTGALSVALAPQRDMRAHATFQNLFVESARVGERALVLRRRCRDAGQELPELIYLVTGDGDLQWETDLEKLVGRQGALGLPGALRPELSGSTGDVLNPCAALRTGLKVRAGERVRLHFALALVDAPDRQACIARIGAGTAADRALQLAAIHARAVLAHAGMDARNHRLAQRLSALLVDSKLRLAAQGSTEACECMDRADLWSTGISGDFPILLMEIGDQAQLDNVRTALRLHAFYRTMGWKADLVLVNHQGSDYHQPAHNGLSEMIASSHLNGELNVAGGVFLLDRPNLSDKGYAALQRSAAVRLRGDADVAAQLRVLVEGLRVEPGQSMLSMAAQSLPRPQRLKFYNEYGGFEGKSYVICLQNGKIPPAPWSNVLAAQEMGAILTERGGGFAWHGNSRSGRLTPFGNDVLQEGWGWMFYLTDPESGEYLRLLPGEHPMTDFLVRFEPGRCRYAGASAGIQFEVCASAMQEGILFEIELRNEAAARELELSGFVDWLMGTSVDDAGALRTWSRFGACFATGMAQGVGCLACDDPQAQPGCDRLTFFGGGDAMQPWGLGRMHEPGSGWTVYVPAHLEAGQKRRWRFLLGWAGDIAGAYALIRNFRSGVRLKEGVQWGDFLCKLEIETPDEGVNLMANGFLQAQTLNARILGRTGLYQPGGAYGFRDQLQDMLAMLHYAPKRVREHLLYCAARQFEAGDVLHWWHDPYMGVRTRISDDLLFLPYVTARYVRVTGDISILEDCVPFLEDVQLPEGTHDLYAQMRPTPHCASLHEHCMRAFRRAARMGEHGLCLMGGGDWNDGMNRVGHEGRGESIWLSEFLAVCAAEYARIAPDEGDRAWLTALNERLCAALEAHGWDGAWYLRAYTDAGERLGSQQCPACKIDLISQAWAVMAGLDEERCRKAVDAAWEMLADETHGLIRLLTPPFDQAGLDPGYIAAYPPGIRENGAQYTHAACWMLCALAQMGDADRAHRALKMLLPIHHARTREGAQRYRVEPYVMAADIYSDAAHAGRGGWTWYTGSAAWMLEAILRLLGYERRGAQVRMNALLGDWGQVSIRIQYGQSRYCLNCRADVRKVELDGCPVEGDFITLVDDGREHLALFPPRQARIRISAEENCETKVKT